MKFWQAGINLIILYLKFKTITYCEWKSLIWFFAILLGAGRVAFSNQQSYIAAISARFVQLQHGDIDKRVSLSFYVYFLTLSKTDGVY